MNAILRLFRSTHLRIVLGLYGVFAAFTLFVLTRQSDSDWSHNWNVLATMGTITGPFTGAIARNLQSCCWTASLRLFPYCAALVVGAVVFQWVPLPAWRGTRVVRLVVWTLGWLGWFGGSVISFGHALS